MNQRPESDTDEQLEAERMAYLFLSNAIISRMSKRNLTVVENLVFLKFKKVIDDFYQPVREEIATRKEIDALEEK